MTSPGPVLPVLLGPAGSDDARRRRLEALGAEAEHVAGQGVAPVLAGAAAMADGVPLPAGGATLERYESLATLGAVDLTVARVLEPHLDALAILAEAPVGDQCQDDPSATYGVWAAEGPGPRLRAAPGPTGGWQLSGTKPWCSLAGEVSHALVTAWVDDTTRGLFRVALDHPGVRVDTSGWAPVGLREVVTGTVTCETVEARPVGPPGWYLRRPGFAAGGVGVAAVWYGATVALARRMLAQARDRKPDQVALLHLGAVDVRLAAARSLLAEAADLVDLVDRGAGLPEGVDLALVAARVRHVVADAVDETMLRCAHSLGPAPLAQEERHARRVADLGLYVRQHHAERDSAALGRTVLDGAGW